jgi:hypothetical protein
VPRFGTAKLDTVLGASVLVAADPSQYKLSFLIEFLDKIIMQKLGA